MTGKARKTRAQSVKWEIVSWVHGITSINTLQLDYASTRAEAARLRHAMVTAGYTVETHPIMVTVQ